MMFLYKEFLRIMSELDKRILNEAVIVPPQTIANGGGISGECFCCINSINEVRR